MTIDELKRRRDGHLSFGPTPSSQRAGLVPILAPLGYERDRRTGRIIGVLTSDGGIGAISWGLKPEADRRLIEAEYQGA